MLVIPNWQYALQMAACCFDVPKDEAADDAAHPSPFPWLLASAATATLLLDLTATTVIVPFLPSYGLDSGQTSAVFLAKPVAEMVSNLLALGPGLADAMGPRRPAIFGMLLVALAVALLCLDVFGGLFQARLLGGIGASLSVPALLKLVGATLENDPGMRDRVTSIAMAGDALGGVVGPVLGSALFNALQRAGASDVLSRGVPCFTVSLLCLMCAGLIYAVPDRRPGVAGDASQPVSLTDIVNRRGISNIAVAAVAFAATSFQIGSLESTSPHLLIGYGEASSGYPWSLVGLGFCLSAPLSIMLMHRLRIPPFCSPLCQEYPLWPHLGKDPREDRRDGAKRSEGPSYKGVGGVDSMRSPPLRHAWFAVMCGGVLLVAYHIFLYWAVRPMLSPSLAAPHVCELVPCHTRHTPTKPSPPPYLPTSLCNCHRYSHTLTTITPLPSPLPDSP